MSQLASQSRQQSAQNELTNDRYAVAVDNDLGGATNRAPGGTMATAAIPYQYSRLGSGSIAATIPKEAGAILAFDAIPATNGTAVSHHSRVRAAKIGR